MSYFKFNYTCPIIDEYLDEISTFNTDAVNTLIDEICPLIDEEQKDELVSAFIADIQDNLSVAFEEVRDSNSEMREAAEEQLIDMANEMDDVQAELGELEESTAVEIEELKGRVNSQEDEIAILEAITDI